MPREMNVSMVGSIERDSSGIVWLGTNCGVFSYDGYSMSWRSHNVAGGHVYCMKDIPGDALYVGEEHGLWAYDYKEADFRSWLEGSPREIRSIVWDGDKLWVGSSTGLYTYDLGKGEWRKVEGGSLGNEVIYSLIKASDGNVYIGTYNGLYYYERQHGHFRNISLPHLPRRDNVFVNVLLEDESRECIWVGTNGRLYRYGTKTNVFSDVGELEGNFVKSLAIDAQGSLLIGTDNGLYILDENENITHIQHDARDGDTSLANDVVWCILPDKDGLTWFGTDEGVSILDNGTGIPFTSVSDITGLSRGNHFSRLLCDRSGRLWLGGSEGLICTSPDLKGSVWYSMDNPSSRIEHNRIRRIYEDPQGVLWICTDGGVHFNDGHGWKHVNLVDPLTGRNANWAYDICEDAWGRMWVASYMGGLMVVGREKLLESSGECKADSSVVLSDGEGLSPFQIAFDGPQTIWVAYYNEGIRRINPLTLAVEEDPVVTEKLSGEQPSCIFVDSSSRLWLGLGGRVLCREGTGVREFRLNKRSGGVVNWIIEVDGGIWFGVDSEVWLVEEDDVRCVLELGSAADIAYYDGIGPTVYVGTNDGVYCAPPERILGQRESKRIVLSGVSANNRPVGHMSGHMVFSPEERHLDFMVSDLSYIETRNIRFLYRLRGVDSDWYELPKGSNTVTFNNLPFGRYILDVTRRGFTDDEGTMLSVPFVIRHPWYLTGWAYVSYAILLLGLVLWCIDFFRTRNRLHFERREKEQILEQIELKKEFLTTLSKDLQGPLGNMLSPVSQMLSETTDAETAAQMKNVQKEAENLSSVIRNIATFGQDDKVKEDSSLPGMSSSDERFLKEVNAIMEEHLSDGDFNVQSLCEKMGYGSKYVYRKLKQLTGKTPVDYLRSFRLGRAASLLEQKKFTVTEVMYMTGFNSPSYFSRCFLSEYGCTPREYPERV